MVMRTPEEQKVWQTAKRSYLLLAISPHVGRCVGASRSLNLKPWFRYANTDMLGHAACNVML